MLSPEQIEQAGDAVAAVYSNIEAKMLDLLVDALLQGDALSQEGITALALLAQTHGNELQAIIDANRSAIDDAVRETVEEMLELSDADDMERTGAAAAAFPRQIAATIQGVAEILERDNLQMVEGAKKAFLDASIEAITRVNAGSMTAERALHAAVRSMERKGIPIITYQNRETGTVTVENKTDVAVRRHIRTQIAQDGARLTLQRMEESEVALVEVSSHAGARPEHAKWQGQVYSLHGAITIGGVRYKDFRKETDYGSVTGLGGANCRHSFGPYRHGAPRAYEPDPKHPSGLPSDEVYELEQEQRYLERRIRASKREVRGAQQVHDKLGTLESRAELAKAQEKLKRDQAAMRGLIDKTNAKSKTGAPVLRRHKNREWAGDMPKSPTIKTSGRKFKEFVDSDAMTKQRKAAGMSKKDFEAELKNRLEAEGLDRSTFPTLTIAEQQAFGKSVLQTRRKATEREKRRKNVTPCNEALYSSQVNYVKRHGGDVIRGGEEAEKLLDKRGADALNYGEVIIFAENPTTSEVLEEVYHFKQNERGDYSDKDAKEMAYLREIDAQKYLLSVTSQYNVPIEEVEQTKQNLERYERELEKWRAKQ